MRMADRVDPASGRYLKLTIDIPNDDLDSVVEALEGLVPSILIQQIENSVVSYEYTQIL